MNLLFYPNEFLNKTLKPVDLENPGFDPIAIKNEMVDIMLANNGIGLSASQVGLDAQLFVMGNNKDDAIICINPTILEYTHDTFNDIEGCLSFPGIFVSVKRPKEIVVRYWDEKLEENTCTLQDYSLKCFLHEWDHLQGITFKDRVSNLKWELATKKANKRKGK